MSFLFPSDPARHARVSPWLTLAAALMLTAAATAFVGHATRARDAARFENAVQAARDRIIGRIEVYETTLRAAAGMFAVTDTVTAAEFRTYVRQFDLDDRHPGLQGIGWSERIERDSLARPDERHTIRYLEPQDDRNQAAMGFDMYSEPTRRLAMMRARDSGTPVLSGGVTLAQEIRGPTQAGFLLYVPVYVGGEVPATVEARREQLQGFVYSPFRADDLFQGIFGSEAQPRVNFRVYDGAHMAPADLLYASPRTPGHEPRFTRADTLHLAGRTWGVAYGSEPVFERASGGFLLPAILLAGLLGSLLLFHLSRGQARAQLEAEQANRAKGEFLAHMSHELRTPLNAIGGYAELMQMGVPGPVTADQNEYLERIHRAQQHLLGLINDILNFAKLEAGRVEYRTATVTVADAVGEAETMLAPQLGHQDVRLVRHGGPEHAAVRADPEKLRQVLLNIMSNAAKFTPDGGEIHTGWEVVDGQVRVTVRDTGIGIPHDRLRAIFDPFVQVDPNPVAARQGTGLGLSIAREIVQAMGGDISVESEPGRGSTFSVTLPLHAAAPSSGGPGPAAGSATPPDRGATAADGGATHADEGAAAPTDGALRDDRGAAG